MFKFARKQKLKQQGKLAGSDSSIRSHAHSGHSGEMRSILHLQRTIGNRGVQRLLETNKRITRGCDICIEGRIGPPVDTIHGPLLDQYSHDTGLPRETVTQHDPGYEQWLRDRQPINITLDMPVPATPAPDYSRDENQLGAWERAVFRFTPQLSFRCDHVLNNGIESSFVTEIGIQLTRPTVQYFIASHIYENSRGFGVDRGARVTWSTIHGRVTRHAREHFTRFRQVIESMRQTIMQRFASLPTRNNPVQIPRTELEEHVNRLLRYLVARLRFELWQATCDWEHEDYPNILRRIPSVSGRLVPACDPRPAVPPEPIMPLSVTPGASRTGPSERQTGPSQ